jgi:class 3 adenylate cyclase
MDRYVRSFAEPDELVDLESVRSAMITRDGITVSYDVQRPGWRWSKDIGPLVGTEWCAVRHIGVMISGRMHILLKDGTEYEVGPLSLMEIPADHDAWTVGDEPAVTIAWAGVKEWLKPFDTMSERVLATLVFTDIVDSTGTAARLGRSAWGQVLATHLQRSRDMVAHFRGRTVETTGDGLLAMFDGAARAVRCAVALRDAAAAMGLPIRAAVLTGEVDLVDENIRGIAIHEASRVLGLAGANQVLLSATTAALIGDAGIALEDLGERELRGFDSPRRIYSVA